MKVVVMMGKLSKKVPSESESVVVDRKMRKWGDSLTFKKNSCKTRVVLSILFITCIFLLKCIFLILCIFFKDLNKSTVTDYTFLQSE